MTEIKINMDNLSDEERERLIGLIEKANRPSRVWKPKENEDYFLINSNGSISNCYWTKSCFNICCYEMGNVFRTEVEASEKIERHKILIKWKRLSIESGEEDNEWDGKNRHWPVTYDGNLLQAESWASYKNESTYFRTKESLINAIKEIGEENVKKYILDIKEVMRLNDEERKK